MLLRVVVKLFIIPTCILCVVVKTNAQEKGFSSLFLNQIYDNSIPYESQVNPRVVPFVREYVKKQGPELQRMKTWGKSYFKLYDGILKKYRIPLEMKYLSVIESHLQSNLVSWAGAVGPWQIMDYEATRFGLRVGKIDDRTDYTKSTHVACKLMKELYAEFKDWLLVVAAYNGGAGRMRNAIKKSGSRDFWDLQNYLVEETRNHVKKFIATHYVFEGKGTIEEEFGVDELNDSANTLVTKTNATDSIVLNGRYNASVICKYIGMNEKEFNMINPKLSSVLTEGKRYTMHLPADKITVFLNNKYKILQESVDALFNIKAK